MGETINKLTCYLGHSHVEKAECGLWLSSLWKSVIPESGGVPQVSKDISWEG